MILYLDTSALVKLYVDEAASDVVRRAVADVTHVATSRVAYPEARAAFARRHLAGDFSRLDLRRVVAALDRDFSSLVVMELGVAATAIETMVKGTEVTVMFAEPETFV